MSVTLEIFKYNVDLQGKVYKKTEEIALVDNRFLDFIEEFKQVFLDQSRHGLILNIEKPPLSHIQKCIDESDLMYLEPALVNDFLHGKKWEDVGLNEAGFMMYNSSWVEFDVWFGFFPYMVEIVLRSDRYIEEIFDSFIYALILNESKLQFIKSDKFPEFGINKMSKFFNLFEEKFSDDDAFELSKPDWEEMKSSWNSN
jgi:hypothetical protein